MNVIAILTLFVLLLHMHIQYYDFSSPSVTFMSPAVADPH